MISPLVAVYKAFSSLEPLPKLEEEEEEEEEALKEADNVDRISMTPPPTKQL
jgi:hypothetical protein